MVPLYLYNKLKAIKINSKHELLKYNYLQVFKWLKTEFPSLNNKVLFHLYSIYNDIPLNTINENLKKSIFKDYKDLLPSHKPLDNELMLYFMNYIHNIALFSEDIPVVASVVYENEIIATAANKGYEHAETIVINKAITIVGTNRLYNCDIYVNIEPCLQCAGAIINSKFKRLIFGANEKRTGAVTSQYKVFNNKIVNHYTEAIGPINHQKFAIPIKNFFKNKR